MDWVAVGTIVSAVVSAVATGILAVITYKYLQATRQIVTASNALATEAQSQREANLRPVVVVQLATWDAGFISPTVKFWNIGPGPALNITLSINLSEDAMALGRDNRPEKAVPLPEPMKDIGLPGGQDEAHAHTHRLGAHARPRASLPGGNRYVCSALRGRLRRTLDDVSPRDVGSGP